MKTKLLRHAAAAAALVLWSAPLFGADARPAAPASADPEVQAILDRARAPMRGRENPPSVSLRANDDSALQLRELALAYLKTHASGPDRAKVILALNTRRPNFVKEIKPGYDEKPSTDLIVYDNAAREAWVEELGRLLRSVAADATAEPAQRTQARGAAISATMYSADTPAKVEAIHAELEKMAAEPGGAERAAQLFTSFLYAAAGMGVKDFEAYLARVAAGPQPELAAAAKTALDNLKNQQANIGKLKFTAADGRAVDVNALKGKVVLVDFWATWCGPCIAELPNVIANYEKYHAKGFEIIGVSFENSTLVDQDALDRLAKQREQMAKANPQRVTSMAPLPALDTPEVAADKLAKAKKKMLDFTVEKKMPWPQHYDGKYWNNEFGKLYGIRAIPAMFLIDQQGNIVSTNARGEKLERELKRLLKL